MAYPQCSRVGSPSRHSINELAKVLFAQNNLRLCEDIYESYNDRIEQELMQCSSGQLVLLLLLLTPVHLPLLLRSRSTLRRQLQTGERAASSSASDLRSHCRAQPSVGEVSCLVSRRILFFLIPVNMMFGVLASDATLERYGMTMVSVKTMLTRSTSV